MLEPPSPQGRDGLVGTPDTALARSTSGQFSHIMTLPSSWSGTRRGSAQNGRPPIAWAGVRHQIKDVARAENDEEVKEREQVFAMGHCNQVVMLTCLHLADEMALREVGQYCWITPNNKDPVGSTLKIMKAYEKKVVDLDRTHPVTCRLAPDPSKRVIQHHLQKARLAAGTNSYIAVVYLGHGIQEPPTEAGELWCYDRSFDESSADGTGPSEYIPILLFDMLTWAGASTCYVWDCQYAGRFINAAKSEAAEIDSQLQVAALQNPQVAELHPPVYSKRQIHFAACGANQILPRIPGLPDDLFTACLTCPTQISLYYHNLQTFPLTTKGREKDYIQRSPAYMQALWDNMSHDLRERLWSELQAIMHTIAWQALPSSEYQILFGQEGRAISSMAGGFVLSQRVLATYRTQPESIPFIPPTNAHSLWIHWDLILDNLFAQLPKYFDATRIDTSWEANLKLGSFMDDQLGSILTSNQGPSSDTSAFANDAALSRLPIICQAAQTPQYRVQACKALEACIQNLDVAGLGHAINCGVLEVATQLLELDDPTLLSFLVSIWASLVRHSSCIKRLAGTAKVDPNGNGNGNGNGSEPSPPHRIVLFISHLEDNLQNRSEDNTTRIIQNAAVVATAVAALPDTLSADQLCHTLELAYLMLQDEHSLVQQWGALLTAEILGSTPKLAETCHEAIEDLREQLSELLASKIVETRTTAVNALSRWIPSVTVNHASDLKEALDIAMQVMDLAAGDAALLMRRELVHLFAQVLHAAGQWATLALWISIMDDAIKRLLMEATTLKAKELLVGLHLSEESHRALVGLKKVLAALEYLHRDPDRQISSLAATQLQQLGETLRGTVPLSHWDQIMVTTLPGNGTSGEWRPDLVTQVIGAGERLVKDWDDKIIVKTQKRHNSQLFVRSKLSLQAYINKETKAESFSEHLRGQPQNMQEKTWILRHRILEDSLVVAEQQRGLPWKWEMKEISSPEPWSNLTCHSFHSAMMSCNKSQDLLLWDWASSRKIGHIHLDLKPGEYIKYGRFVNELHATTAVLAEINNGDIYIFAGPPNEPNQMKLISSFKALDFSRAPVKIYDPEDRGLHSTWFRQSGLLVVGGPTKELNVWDCPAEQRLRVFQSGEDAATATIITEPKQGNLFTAAFWNGKVRLFDLRQRRNTSVLDWQGDHPGKYKVMSNSVIRRLGIVLGESRHFTCASANGMINIHDLRNLARPVTSTLAHPSGIAHAHFQPHSGLMSTISNLYPSRNIDTLNLAPLSVANTAPHANWTLHRSTLSDLSVVSQDNIVFGHQSEDVLQGGFKPYTVIHPLRPFLSLGYGRTCYMRGSGVGKGDDTDSGSYSFLRAQAKFIQ